MILIFILIIIIDNVYSAPGATQCTPQLKTFYESLGMSPVTLTEFPFNFTSGTFMGVDFVTIGLNVQQVAFDYAFSFGHTPLPNNSYMSFDLPYCWSNISYFCVERIIFGITKTGNCSLLVDRDISLGTYNAGRLFVYPDPQPPCSGTASVTISNVNLSPIEFNSLYSYDIDGIFTGVLKTQTAALFAYRNSPCDETDGDSSDVGLGQFTCVDRTLECNINPRPFNTDIISPADLIVLYRCTGTLLNGNQGNIGGIVQVINTNTSTFETGIEEEFDLMFISTLTGLPLTNTYLRQLITAQTIRQFNVGTASFLYNTSTAFGGLNFTSAFPVLPPLPSIILPSVPCLCNFSVVCDQSGNIDLSSNGTNFFENNSIPIVFANVSAPVVRLGGTVFLNDNGSFDPDMSPQSQLTFFWVLVESISNINISIQNPTNQFNASFTTYNFTTGTYIIALLASDGQDLNFTLVNVTTVDVIPTCIVLPIITGNVNDTIFLDATQSFDPLGDPLNATWTQQSGFPVVIENNQTLLASFQSEFSGTYIFVVTISNGIQNCTFITQVNINPSTFAPIVDNSTMAPFVTPDNRTTSPVDANQTDIPGLSDPPFQLTHAPSTFTPTPTGSTPVFPPVPIDTIVWHSILFWVLAGLFMGLSLILFFYVLVIDNDDSHNRLVVPNKYIMRK